MRASTSRLRSGSAGGTAAAVLLASLSALAVAPMASAAERQDSRATYLRVQNEQQLRRAVLRANRTDRLVVARLRSDVRLSPRKAGAGGPLRGDLDLTGRLRLVGFGHTIDARRTDRIFDVGDEGRLAVRRTRLTGGAPAAGESGGAVRSSGSVDLRGSRVVGNRVTGDGASGGALMNDGGRMVVVRSRLGDNRAVRAGGAIEADAGFTRVRLTRMVDNTTGDGPGNGGGLHLTGAGTVQVLGSWVLRNRAAAEGGGLWNSATGTMHVARTTLGGNRAAGAAADNGGGAVYNDGGSLDVLGGRMRNNAATGAAGSGGAVFVNGGEVDVDGTVLQDNDAPRAGGAVEVTTGTVRIMRSEMSGNSSGDAPGNGGALHVTGAADVTVATTRVADNTAASEGGGLWNSADGTMRVLNSRVLDNVAAGADADNGGGGVFNNGGDLEVTCTTVSGNAARGAAGSGGGLLNLGGRATVLQSMVSSNTASRAGGGIEATAGSTTSVQQSTLADNTTGAAPGNGGGLHLTGAGEVAVLATTVSGNTAAAEGGGLWNSAIGTMVVRDSTITDNTAAGADADQGGGGLYNDGGALSITDSEVSDNTATGTSGSGGGLLNKAGQVTATDSVFARNTAVRAGGGIETVDNRLELTRVDLTDNTVGSNPGNGGGVHIGGSGVLVYRTGAVTGNSAASEGGGVWISVGGTYDAQDVTVTGNTAPVGPDVYQDVP